MEKKWIIVGVVVLALITLMYFFSPSERFAENMSEKYIEQAIERETGGTVDVDYNNSNVTVETEEGSFSSGNDVKLPEDFPSDVYVFGGKLLSVIKTNEDAVMISIETDKTPAEVKAAYEEKLKSDGWELTGTMDFGDSVSLIGKKGTRTISVVISTDGSGKTNIVLSVAQE